MVAESSGESTLAEAPPEPQVAAPKAVEVVPESTEKSLPGFKAVAVEKPPKTEEGNRVPLMSLNAAKQQIAPEVLEVLAEKFNGQLSEMRHVDEKDVLFNQ